MKPVLRLFALSALALVLTNPSRAADKLLDIVRKDGSVQEVTYEDFEQIGQVTIVTPLIGEDKADHRARGALIRDVLAHFKADGESADVIALDNYEQLIPVEDFEHNVILATEIDGKRLRVRDKGPTWVVYPLKDDPSLNNPVHESRSVWQVKEIRMK